MLFNCWAPSNEKQGPGYRSWELEEIIYASLVPRSVHIGHNLASVLLSLSAEWGMPVLSLLPCAPSC